jgi:AcrR family transcriptional regulator
MTESGTSPEVGERPAKAPHRERRRARDAARRARVAGHIERTAIGLFAEHGFANVTVAAVAKGAEVSPATVARYFPLKEDLLLAIPRANHRVALAVLASLRGDPKPISGFVTQLGRLAGELRESQATFNEWLRAIETAPEVQSKAMGETFAALGPALTELCAEALGVDQQSDPRPSALASAILAADAAKNRFWANNQSGKGIDQLLTIVHASLVHDLGNL